MNFAYMRISTNKKTQKIDRQQKTISDYALENGIDLPPENYYSDIISGGTKAENREQYSLLKGKMRSGDILLLCDIDRLGRNADDVILELKLLKQKGIRVIALDVPFMNDYKMVLNDDMYNMIIDILITLKAHLAEQEKKKIHDRIMQGLATSKAKGIKSGRPPVKLPNDFIKDYQKWKSGDYGEITAVQFAKMQGIGRSTLYKYITLLKKEKM